MNHGLAFPTERAALRRTEIYQEFDVWSADFLSDAGWSFSIDADSIETGNSGDSSDSDCSGSDDSGSCDSGSAD